MIEVQQDSATLDLYLAALAARQTPFAVSKAINETALLGQLRVRDHLSQVFTLKRRAWAYQNVKITQFAKKTQEEFRATIAIQAPGDAARSDILSKFEPGGVKRPTTGAALAVPAEGLAERRGIIPASLRPKGLHLTVHRTRTGKVQWKGDRRTFIVEKSTFDYGILQRVGSGKGSYLKVLYWFQRAVRIPPVLQFRQTLERVVREDFPRLMREALADAIRTAR